MTLLTSQQPFTNSVYNKIFNNNSNNNQFFNKENNHPYTSSLTKYEYKNKYNFNDDGHYPLSFPFHYDQCQGKCSVCSLEDKMEKLFINNLFQSKDNEFFSPKINIKEDEKYYSIIMKVPEMNKDQIKIEVNEKDRILNILGKNGIEESKEIKETKENIENDLKENSLKEVERFEKKNEISNNNDCILFDKSFFIPKDIYLRSIKAKIIKNGIIKIVFNKKKKDKNIMK